jgi:hypothetical protein
MGGSHQPPSATQGRWCLDLRRADPQNREHGYVAFEAPDELAARQIMECDPTIAGGYAQGELQPFGLYLMRGREEA